MATVKCYSGGKCVKTFKNIDSDYLEVAELSDTKYSGGCAVGHGFTISNEDGVIFEWRGDFLVEY